MRRNSALGQYRGGRWIAGQNRHPKLVRDAAARRANWLTSMIRRARGPCVWVPEYARMARVERQGSLAMIRDVRNFTYRTRDDCTPGYYDALYEIDAVQSVDLIVSRWTAEAIAHVFLSFGFLDGRYLAISIETRRRRGQRYSPYAGFLPIYDLVYVVADERDLLGVRTDVRRERVHLFRADISQATAQALFADYLRRIQELGGQSEFYNTLFNNCTTNILRHIKAVAPEIRFNWKVLLSGYADQYGYELGLLDRSLAFESLKAKSLVARAADAEIDAGFSEAVRARLHSGGAAVG